MARIGKDIVQQRNGWWYENFTTLDGVRHRKTLDTADYAEARSEAGRRLERGNLIARGLVRREDLREAVTLAAAHAHYMSIHGDKTPSRKANADRYRGLLEMRIGAATLTTAIGMREMRDYVSWRQTHHVKRRGRLVPIQARTINLELTHLRAVLNMAKEDMSADLAPLRWRGKRGQPGLMLAEGRRSREIIPSDAAEASLRGFMAGDLRDLFDFAIATSKRFGEIAGLRWPDVRRHQGVVEIMLGKKKGDGQDRLQEIPLAAVDDILRAVAGRHPEFVFAYLCRKTRTETLESGERVRRVEGRWYPWTHSILRDRWSEARAAAMEAGIMAWMSWHRATRATAITRAYLEEGPAIAQGLAGHASGETTREYLGGAAIDVGRALGRAKAARAEAAAIAEGTVVTLDKRSA